MTKMIGKYVALPDNKHMPKAARARTTIDQALEDCAKLEDDSPLIGKIVQITKSFRKVGSTLQPYYQVHGSDTKDGVYCALLERESYYDGDTTRYSYTVREETPELLIARIEREKAKRESGTLTTKLYAQVIAQ